MISYIWTNRLSFLLIITGGTLIAQSVLSSRTLANLNYWQARAEICEAKK